MAFEIYQTGRKVYGSTLKTYLLAFETFRAWFEIVWLAVEDDPGNHMNDKKAVTGHRTRKLHQTMSAKVFSIRRK